MSGRLKSDKIILVVVILISLAWVFPLVIIVLNSFKTVSEMMQNLIRLPTNISLKMYKETWTFYEFPMLLKNTLFYTIGSVLGVVLFAPMAAYKLSRTKTKYSNFIFVVMLLPIMVPFQTYMISLTSLFAKIGLIGTRIGYIVVMIGLLMPLAVFMIHGFVKNIPIELEESAYIDGASKIRTYFSIILPLLVPIITTVAIISTLYAWNDIIVNMLIVGGKANMMNIQNALFISFSSQHSDWGHTLPGIVISIIPNILFFVFMQKYIVKGITKGAIKG